MASNYEAFLNYKTMPHPLREVILKALSFYPELVDIKIEFKINDNIRKSVMQAQPRFTSMLGRRKWRSYIIKISKCFELKGRKIPIHDLPEDVLIGWIGHELGHIMDYMRRNTWSMILFGIGYYTSKSFIIAAERVADTYAVNQGLGDYILATKDFILHQAGMPEPYIQRILKLYMPPEEIMLMLENKLPENG
jgi:hypothetical protein